MAVKPKHFWLRVADAVVATLIEAALVWFAVISANVCLSDYNLYGWTPVTTTMVMLLMAMFLVSVYGYIYVMVSIALAYDAKESSDDGDC